MRSIIRLLLIIFPSALSAQGLMVNYQSFSIDNTDVVWAQVYHTEKTIDEIRQRLFNHLQRKVWIKDIKIEGEDILAELVNYRPDYKRYGGKFMNTSNIIRTGRWTGRVKISFKEEKYRVVLYGIEYTALQPSSGSGKATIEQHPVSGTLSEFALNNYRTAFKKSGRMNLDILHLSFKDSFTLTENQVIDSDW
jgi:hypothetical protein